MTAKKTVEKLTYEEALEELEQVVSAMENNQHPLDEMLALYERGQKLTQHCARLLNQAELKIQQLSANELIPFEASKS